MQAWKRSLITAETVVERGDVSVVGILHMYWGKLCKSAGEANTKTTRPENKFLTTGALRIMAI